MVFRSRGSPEYEPVQETLVLIKYVRCQSSDEPGLAIAFAACMCIKLEVGRVLKQTLGLLAANACL